MRRIWQYPPKNLQPWIPLKWQGLICFYMVLRSKSIYDNFNILLELIYVYKEFQHLSIRIIRKNFLWGEYLINNNKKETTRRKNLGKTNILSNSNITTDIFRKNWKTLENRFIIYDDILDIKNTGDFINGMKKIKLENNNKFNKNYFIIL
jgi:hypothetical protein